jgi:hypothetical protein
MKLLSRLSARMKIRRALVKTDWDSLEVRKAVKLLWASAPALYQGPIGPNATVPIEFAALRRLCEQPEMTETFFAELLDGSNPMLVAYGLAGLRMIDSPRLAAAVKTVSSRHENILVQTGCLGADQQLGEFASRLCDVKRTA